MANRELDMIKLDTEQANLLRAIVEDKECEPMPEQAGALYHLVKNGLVRDGFNATDKGAAVAVADWYASFSRYIDKYPNRRAIFKDTADNLRLKLGKDNLDVWFRCVCKATLALDLFNQYNYFIGGPELMETGRLQELNLSSLYLGLRETTINREKLASLFLPPNMPATNTEGLEAMLAPYIPESIKAIAR